jgi:hypothetical protein
MSTPFYKKINFMIIYRLVLLVAITGGAGGAGFAQSGGDGGGGTPAMDTTAPTNSPTEKLLDPLPVKVTRLGVPTTDLEDPFSPQNAACR